MNVRDCDGEIMVVVEGESREPPDKKDARGEETEPVFV